MPPTLGGKSLVTSRWRGVGRRRPVGRPSTAQPARSVNCRLGTRPARSSIRIAQGLVGVDDHGVVSSTEKKRDHAVLAGVGVLE